MRLINQIIIHSSATPNGVYVSPKQVDQWHAERGFHRDPVAVARYAKALPHIGYHWLIDATGRACAGRNTEEIGAHVAGHNANSVGICMTGTDRFYQAQWLGLADLLCTLAYLWQINRLVPAQSATYPLPPGQAMTQFALMGISIVGHRDLSPDVNGDGRITSIDWLKTCPGFDVKTWLADGMTPREEWLLDDHPAIVSAYGFDRVQNA